MHLYDSVCEYGQAEYVVEKSRFIAHAQPAGSLEEAKEFVASIKEEYRDATHNVPAIIVGAKQEIQWASDDGEPSGTSGLPMLKMIAGEGLTNLAVVVTRYFGGIKLGTGGLARAYTQAARLGLDAAGRCEVRESALIVCEFDYSYLSKLQNLASDGSFELTDPEYSDVVKTGLKCLSEDADKIRSMLINLTSGRAKILYEQKDLIRVRK
ncbi:MAG: YigZ family protein [Mogibacterium sp.]|nr:YigZ family protein [Mogibacterium sp.]MBR2540672.1 YigZ family protein [Mogibacterium sp.]